MPKVLMRGVVQVVSGYDLIGLDFDYSFKSRLHFFLFFIMFSVSWSQFYFLTLFLYFIYYNFRLLYLKKKNRSSRVWCVQLHYMLFISGLLLKAIFVYEKGGQSDAAIKGLLLNVKIDYFKGKCYTLSTFYT